MFNRNKKRRGDLSAQNDEPMMLTEYLGAGLTAQVHLARESSEPNKVIGALKIFKEEHRRIAVKEIENLQNVNHPNCVRILDSGHNAQLSDFTNGEVENNLSFILMEYVAGGSLDDVQKLVKNIDEPGGRFFMEQMCDVMGFLHAQGMCHRDLKPQNIMLDNQLNIRVADFGFLSCRENVDKHRTYMGTRNYMAPEMSRIKEMKQKYYDGRKIDVYSMGITLLNLVTNLDLLQFIPGMHTKKIYEHIICQDYEQFWYEVHSKLKRERTMIRPTDFTPFTAEFKDLIEKMICYKEENRITIDEIKKHPWMLTPFKMHAYRKTLLKMIAKAMSEQNLECRITTEDYDQILKNIQLEDNGGFAKKKILSMMHLVINHPLPQLNQIQQPVEQSVEDSIDSMDWFDGLYQKPLMQTSSFNRNLPIFKKMNTEFTTNISPGVVFEYIKKFNASIGNVLTLKINSSEKFISCSNEEYNFKIRFFASLSEQDQPQVDSIIDEPEMIKQLESIITIKFENHGEPSKFDELMQQICDFTSNFMFKSFYHEDIETNF